VLPEDRVQQTEVRRRQRLGSGQPTTAVFLFFGSEINVMGEAKRRQLARQLAICKVHEAGHALGRFLTAADLGREEHENIWRIDLQDDFAVTYGPMLSEEMETCVRKAYGVRDDEKLQDTSLTREQMRKACEAIDTSRWMQAKLLEIAMGPAAEARFRRKPIIDVLATCKDDHRDLLATCWTARIDDDEMPKHIHPALLRAERIVREPVNWQAINRLADALPNWGSFDGGKAVEILATTLQSPPRPSYDV
jgi:hypothetical protein